MTNRAILIGAFTWFAAGCVPAPTPNALAPSGNSGEISEVTLYVHQMNKRLKIL